MGDDFIAAPPMPVGPVSDHSDHHPGGGASHHRGLASRPVRPRSVIDVASVLGMPEGSIPKPLQDSIAALMQEVEHLRAELALAHHHETWLEGRGDHHPVLPVYHRRAFIRELGRLLEQSQRALLPGSLLYLHVGGIEQLREVHGLAAGEAALRQVADTIRLDLRQTDLLGYLDSGDFVVGLAVAEDEGADEKADAIIAHVTEQPFLWEGRRFLFTVAAGLAHFREGDTAEGLLTIADAARRSHPRG
ncbi:MAG TPA: GGDEF domain-containing protein [Patescibacteria group bacterium]|nr:GGDEF domain-containing protein [Patescibacteria group bacterium]